MSGLGAYNGSAGGGGSAQPPLPWGQTTAQPHQRFVLNDIPPGRQSFQEVVQARQSRSPSKPLSLVETQAMHRATQDYWNNIGAGTLQGVSPANREVNAQFQEGRLLFAKLDDVLAYAPRGKVIEGKGPHSPPRNYPYRNYRPATMAYPQGIVAYAAGYFELQRPRFHFGVPVYLTDRHYSLDGLDWQPNPYRTDEDNEQIKREAIARLKTASDLYAKDHPASGGWCTIL
jgi:hypothetical protein